MITGLNELSDIEVYQALKEFGYRVRFCAGGSIDIDTPRNCLMSQKEARSLLAASRIRGKIEDLDSYGTQTAWNTWFDFSPLLLNEVPE